MCKPCFLPIYDGIPPLDFLQEGLCAIDTGSICLSHGSNRSAPEVQQAAGHVAHISLPQPFPPFPQECEVHPAGPPNRRPQSAGGLHPPFCVSQGCKEGQKGKQLGNWVTQLLTGQSIMQSMIQPVSCPFCQLLLLSPLPTSVHSMDSFCHPSAAFQRTLGRYG